FERSMTLPVLRLKGSPYEIGYRHGQFARDRIERNLEVYFRRFKNETALTRDEALRRAEKYLQVIRRGSPSYARAMEGVAIGLNSEGVGLAINGLISNKDDWERLRKPFHVRCSEVLGSKTLSQAVSRITRGERSCSANFLIGQQTKLGAGKIVDVESAPGAT